MKITIRPPRNSGNTGSFRLALTGRETMALIGQYIPPASTLKAHITLDGSQMKVRINNEEGLMVRPQANVAGNPGNYATLDPVVTTEVLSHRLSSLGIPAPKQSTPYMLEDVVIDKEAKTITGTLPEMLMRKMREYNHTPHSVGGNHRATKPQPMTSTLESFKASLDTLNNMAEALQKNGSDVTLRVENGKVRARVVPVNSFDL
jgi:hypothetical protein